MRPSLISAFLSLTDLWILCPSALREELWVFRLHTRCPRCILLDELCYDNILDIVKTGWLRIWIDVSHRVMSANRQQHNFSTHAVQTYCTMREAGVAKRRISGYNINRVQ